MSEQTLTVEQMDKRLALQRFLGLGRFGLTEEEMKLTAKAATEVVMFLYSKVAASALPEEHQYAASRAIAWWISQNFIDFDQLEHTYGMEAISAMVAARKQKGEE